MKKIGMILILIVTACALLSGCSEKAKQSVSDNVDVKVNIQEMTDYIIEKTEFEDFMSSVDSEIFLSLYNLDESVVKAASMYASTGATAEEVAVITSYDEKGLELIQKACEERVEAQKQAFENYVPEELVKLENPVMKRVGDTFLLVVCNDNDKVEELINHYANAEV